MKIKGAVLREIGKPRPYAQTLPLTIEELELEAPGSGEVLVKIVAAGLCHSDLSVINGDRPRPVPMLLGHEAAGIVESFGPGVEDLKKGDHVVLVFVPSCGLCLPCSQGRPALCEPGAKSNAAGTLLSGARRIRSGGEVVNHHLGVSAFAEFAVVSRRSIVKIDSELPLDEAALFGCAVLTGVGAVINTAQVHAGASVAVVGLGGVGLASILGAAAAGARTVVAVDLSAEKLALAKAMGATDVFLATDQDVVQKIRDVTEGGVEFSFEMAGSIRALDTAYKITRRGGTTVTAGLPPPDQMFSLSPVNLVAEERTLKGSYIGTCIPSRDISRYISLYRKGIMPVDRLLSERIQLEDINAAFDRLHDGLCVRQVIRM